MAKLAKETKQPNEKLGWTIDYSEALDEGDLIISVTNVIDIAGLSVDTTYSDTSVRLVASGGEDGVTYKVTMTVTTTDSNEIMEDEFYLKIKEI